ncbi:MAG: glycogen synthase [Oscillospiraceae bacterium]|nr:glycogen synthase [Oscillospiraceae bacterium]
MNKSATPKKTRGKGAGQKILFAVSEVAPFVATGGMGQVVGTLPLALKRVSEKTEVRVISPLYRKVRRQFGSGMEFLGDVWVHLSWRSQYCGVFKLERDGVIYYFIDNERYFDRDEVYGSYDDGERFAFFSKAVPAVLELIDYVPDIIHAHDWQTALVPVYISTTYAERYPDIRTVFTIHNIEYQGKFPMAILGDVFDLQGYDMGLVEYNGCINLMKGAIVCCDRLTTVSPSYAQEITSGGGYGLDSIIADNIGKLSGIINGIDTEFYDPASDPALAQKYDVDSVEKKAANKKALQKLFGLPVNTHKPVLCVVSRLVSHKGIDLLLPIMEELVSDDVQFLLLGTGDDRFQLFFTELGMKHPDKIGINIAFNPEVSNKIYAGSDIMLMPSLSEPCGLSQMIACRYGTVPIVRAVGGIKDTIRDCRLGEGNGFVFRNYESGELLDTIRKALHMFTHHPDQWEELMKEGMRTDFSWDLSAKAYIDMYSSLR